MKKISVLSVLIFLFAGVIFPIPINAEEPLRAVAFGDSTTAGAPGFRSPAEQPPNGSGNEMSQYAYWIRKRHSDWHIVNRGVSGERTDQILKRFDSDVLSYQPQWVIVLAGVNDIDQGFPAQWTIVNLKLIYEKARAANIQVMACTILPYNQASGAAKAKIIEVNEWIHSYSLERGMRFCDTFHLLQDSQKPWNLPGSPDGLHPDVNGYHKMGDLIANILERSQSQSKS